MFNAGDIVTPREDIHTYITRDNDYEVLFLDGEYVRIVDDDGDEESYMMDEMELVASAIPHKVKSKVNNFARWIDQCALRNG